MRAILISMTVATALAFSAGGAAAAKSKCERVTSTASGAGVAMAKELAMQSLVEAIRDTRMKGQGRITYTCNKLPMTTCTARQRACRRR